MSKKQKSTEEIPILSDVPVMMSLGDHLEELRQRLVKIIIALLVVFVAILSFKNFIFTNIILAPKEPWFITNILMCRLGDFLNSPIICINQESLKIVSIQLSGQFSAHLLVSLVIAIAIVFPFIIYQLWLFVKPAMFITERKKFRFFVLASSASFTIGISFGYFVIVPLTIHFFGTYKVAPDIENTIALMSYVSTVSLLTFIMGVVFQLPLLVVMLSGSGIITASWMRKNRKIVFVAILVLAAIITPPDVFSLLLVSMPIYFLYEFSIFICKR